MKTKAEKRLLIMSIHMMTEMKILKIKMDMEILRMLMRLMIRWKIYLACAMRGILFR